MLVAPLLFRRRRSDDANRDKLDPGFVQGVGDRRVVLAVASEAVDLVDDHVVEVTFCFQASQNAFC